jgi:hypothetical protein
VCLDWAPHTLSAVPAAEGVVDVELTAGGRLDPWPFAVADLTVRTEGRRLAGRYADEEELRAAWAAAPWLTLELRLAPAG